MTALEKKQPKIEVQNLSLDYSEARLTLESNKSGVKK